MGDKWRSVNINASRKSRRWSLKKRYQEGHLFDIDEVMDKLGARKRKRKRKMIEILLQKDWNCDFHPKSLSSHNDNILE